MGDSVIIYIRHGKDKKNKHQYKYDPKLTSNGKEEAKILAEELISEYGIPDIIYFSPYARTRQTLKHMLRFIGDKTDQKIIIKLDTRLSRFFTKSQMYDPDIRYKTKKLGAPIYEKWWEFKQRVKDQMKDIENEAEHKVIWCVCHTLILKLAAKYKNIDQDKYIKYLDTVVIKNNYL